MRTGESESRCRTVWRKCAGVRCLVERFRRVHLPNAFAECFCPKAELIQRLNATRGLGTAAHRRRIRQNLWIWILDCWMLEGFASKLHLLIEVKHGALYPLTIYPPGIEPWRKIYRNTSKNYPQEYIRGISHRIPEGRLPPNKLFESNKLYPNFTNFPNV